MARGGCGVGAYGQGGIWLGVRWGSRARGGVGAYG